MKQKIQRIDYLDAVRGIAALMVVFYHYFGWHWGDSLHFKLSCLLFNGSDAVSFFFVLSGFVLSYKYFHSDRPIEMKKYTFNRFLRLYPAFIFTVLINYMYVHRHDLGFDLDMVKDMLWLNQYQLWEELLMVRHIHNYYPPGWTLAVEMGLSLLVPVFILAAQKRVNILIWFLPISVIMGPNFISVFAFHFALGMLLSYYYKEIQAYDFKASKWYSYRWLIYLATFLLFSMRHIERIYPFPSIYYKVTGILQLDRFFFTGIASFIILLIIMNGTKIQKALNWKPLHFLGKISYSVYLIHWLIVLAIMERWDKWVALFGDKYLAFGTMLLVALVLTFSLATAMYYWIEKPFIRLSKKISAKF